ncbi:MAG: hypothetical protein ACPHJE_05015 [Poseidonia sp.]
MRKANLRTICLKHKPELKDDVRPLTPAAFAVLLLSSMLAGCIGGNLENDFVYPDDVWYASTNATIVEVWEDGERVETNYPVLSFDFNESNAPSPFVAYSVRGALVDETVDASQTTVVEVEFQHHGLHTLQLIADYQDTPDERGNDSRHLNEIVVRIEKRIEWRESSTNEPIPMTLDTRREVGDETASVIVIESTVHNPELINNIGGGQDVEVSWQLIDNTQEACQSQPGTVEEGGTATWKTVHFNTDEVHELRVNYEEGQDAIDVEQTILIQYEHLEDAPNA